MGYIRILSVLLLFGIILVIVAGEKEVGEGSIQQLHHYLFQEDFQDPTRDVLKGKNHDLVRSKRYIGRVPISYMKKIPSIDEGSEDDEDDLISSSGPSSPQQSRAPSHFREFQVKQNVNTNVRSPAPYSSPRNELTIEEPRMLSAMSSTHRNQRRYNPNAGKSYRIPTSFEDEDMNPLSESDIQTLLLMIDGYEMRGKNRMRQRQPPNPLIENMAPRTYYNNPISSLLISQRLDDLADMNEVGKRETGKRSPKTFELEQPMNFDNALYPGDRLEFLNEKRSKRIGARNLMAKTSKSSNRFKKETDPAVLAILNRVFTQEKVNEPKLTGVKADGAQSATKPASSSTMDSHSHEKSKKSIDWSNYLGVDKRVGNTDNLNPKSKAIGDEQGNRQGNGVVVQGMPAMSASPTSQVSTDIQENSQASHSPSTNSILTTTKAKESSNKLQEQEQNTIKNKEDDRNWMLHQFYKNFAMSTNVKRKRESPSTKPQSDLEKLEELEQKMTQAGDKIIWDALKYTGAHRDEPMSPSDLAQVKNSIIKKVSTAYSLEKVREALEEIREQIKALDERNQE